jgi:hypothetical protein
MVHKKYEISKAVSNRFDKLNISKRREKVIKPSIL